jgi:hypothetical protein
MSTTTLGPCRPRSWGPGASSDHVRAPGCAPGSVVLPPANNLFVGDLLNCAMVLILLAPVGAGRTLGLDRAWESVSIEKRHGWLR